MQFRTFELDSADDMQALPSHVKWVREGLLIIGLDTEMQVYSQWSTHQAGGPKPAIAAAPADDSASSVKSRRLGTDTDEKDKPKSLGLIVRKNHSVLDLHKLHKMTKDPVHAKKMANLGDDLTERDAGTREPSINSDQVNSWSSGKNKAPAAEESSRKFDQSEMLEIIQDSGLFMQAK
jgi:hypothetical protein